uniref:Uncharacterized protein n=1 Tax=Siphoviridae sp. ctzpQ31 TaxID=2823613 RepID=A0A8S5L895_9CAUD|nr:MAG TPA: hypothetical protein [Siphoviridae sp. ctzpQ31]
MFVFSWTLPLRFELWHLGFSIEVYPPFYFSLTLRLLLLRYERL